jgi:hypothetical protein
VEEKTDYCKKLDGKNEIVQIKKEAVDSIIVAMIIERILRKKNECGEAQARSNLRDTVGWFRGRCDWKCPEVCG